MSDFHTAHIDPDTTGIPAPTGAGHTWRVDAFGHPVDSLPVLLIRWRRHHGISQREAAERVDVQPETWDRWERTPTPTPRRHNVSRIAGLLGLPLGALPRGRL